MYKSCKRWLWQWRGVWIVSPTVTALIILLRWIGMLQTWEWACYDQYMRWRPSAPLDQRIAIVGIDEADLKKIGQLSRSILPDQIYAQAIAKLKTHNPKAIGLDVYRDLPVQPGHQELVRIFETTPNLVGIEKVVGDKRQDAVAAPPVLKAKGQVGANDVIFDADTKVRRALLQVENANGNVIPSFGFYLALLYLDAQGISPQPIPGEPNTWQLGKSTFSRFKKNDGGYVRTDDGGYQILLNYRGSKEHFETISLHDLLEDRIPPDWGRDRIILIGFVGESFQDWIFTPYSSSWFALPERMSGVELHANLTSQILSAALQGRPLIQTFSQLKENLWIFFWSTVGAILTWQGRYQVNRRRASVQRFSGLILAGGIVAGSSYGAFLIGWWIPVVPPLLALSGSVMAITSYLAHQVAKIRETFGRYLTTEVVANVLENPSGAKLGGERRTVTILTSDLRGFTALTERLTPEEVVNILNFYFGTMTDVITQYQGTIDEFLGDGILVLFGAPTLREDDARRAIACAVAMQLAMTSVNERMKLLGLPPLTMGIGINTGEVIVGNIGSSKRTKYGVVGSQVNLAYRIESYTTDSQILISQSTLNAAGSGVRIDGKMRVQPKGLPKPIPIYEVGGIGKPYSLFLTKPEEQFMPLVEPIPLHYTFLDGKHVSDLFFRGTLVKLSAKGGEICSEQVMAPLTNIKINLLVDDRLISVNEDIYAKVLDKPSDDNSFYIHFTFLPPNVETMLSNHYKLLRQLQGESQEQGTGNIK
ncbi:MAG: adenylate/guanylate cyclase domain-containing protein [Coleofasciculus sp. G1-WW12-02]|uniref:CHASE2 domain-containing protein n=1 Tax=Coleofasciculus sp. G1-WW12-02 TaxID=3068483 RepID=UPI0032F7F08B